MTIDFVYEFNPRILRKSWKNVSVRGGGLRFYLQSKSCRSVQKLHRLIKCDFYKGSVKNVHGPGFYKIVCTTLEQNRSQTRLVKSADVTFFFRERLRQSATCRQTTRMWLMFMRPLRVRGPPFNRHVENNPKDPAQSRVSVSKMCTNTRFTSVVWLQKRSKHHVVNKKDFLPRKEEV